METNCLTYRNTDVQIDNLKTYQKEVQTIKCLSEDKIIHDKYRGNETTNKKNSWVENKSHVQKENAKTIEDIKLDVDRAQEDDKLLC